MTDPYLDVDTTDAFLDLDEPVYGPMRRPLPTGAALDVVLTDDYRRARKLPPAPELPPVTWS